MNKVKLKRGDMVRVIAGKEIGRSGRVLLIDREKMKVLVEGLNMQTKHQKSNRANQQGGITRREAPLAISNVMYLHNDKPTRIGYRLEVTEVEVNGRKKRKVIKKRIAKSTGEEID